jgi:hypothetical protein
LLETNHLPLPDLVVLQDQVDIAIEQLTTGVQRLQEITQENKEHLEKSGV